jgi:hypothetical protein
LIPNTQLSFLKNKLNKSERKRKSLALKSNRKEENS